MLCSIHTIRVSLLTLLMLAAIPCLCSAAENGKANEDLGSLVDRILAEEGISSNVAANPAVVNNTQLKPTAAIPATPIEAPKPFEDRPNVLKIGSGINAPETITISLPGNVLMELVRIPAGAYFMGKDKDKGWALAAESPIHQVLIDEEDVFYIGKYEVTQEQWKALIPDFPKTHAPSKYYGLGDQYPVYYISWDDAKMFIQALNAHIQETGQGLANYRLPSESEWEYACRAGTNTRFYYPNNPDDSPSNRESPGVLGDYAWFSGNNGGYGHPTYGPKPVGGRIPNAFGLYDMHGNVSEWCGDWFHANYSGPPIVTPDVPVDELGRKFDLRTIYINNDPTTFPLHSLIYVKTDVDGTTKVMEAMKFEAPVDGTPWYGLDNYLPQRVVRGGSWNADARDCRSSARRSYDPGHRNVTMGFRLARYQYQHPVAPFPDKKEILPPPRVIVEKQIHIITTDSGIEYRIAGDAVLFHPGSAKLTAEGSVLVDEVLKIILEKYPDNNLVIQGFTDIQPIVHSGWRSNWELGAARALTLVHYLIDKHKFNPAKLSAMTYSEYKPDKPSDSWSNLQANRRAVITVKTKTVHIEKRTIKNGEELNIPDLPDIR